MYRQLIDKPKLQDEEIGEEIKAVETNEIAEVLRQQNEILRKLNKLLQTSLDTHK